MARHTFTLSDDDEAMLRWFVESYLNPQRDEPYADNDAFIAARVEELMVPVRRAFNEYDRAQFIARYDLATLAQRAASKAELPELPQPEPEPEPEPVMEDGLVVSRI
jgi:hypothetical protein